MALALPSDDIEKQSVLIIDSFGKVLSLPIMKVSSPRFQNVPFVPKDFLMSEVVDWVDEPKDRGSLVAVTSCGYILGLVYRRHCTFRHVENGNVIGKILFSENELYAGDKLYIVGGVFLDNNASISSNVFVKEFVAWNNSGAAVIYQISYLSNIFKTDPLSLIPAVLHPSDVRLSFSFVSLDKYLLRVESICLPVKERKFWRPRVTVWLLPEKNGDFGKLHSECKLFGKGDLFAGWTTSSSSSTNEGLEHENPEEGTIMTDKMTQLESGLSAGVTYVTDRGGQLVLSSMVISENHPAPYAIVYGFCSGDIEIVRFDMFFPEIASLVQSSHHEANSQGQKQHLSGHRGAVLCLASHQMVISSGEGSLRQVLLSGSMDCTVRVWDLDSGRPIMVLHQHVAPVRQIILPPSKSEYPWSDCFLTVGDDSCIALVSLQTMRVERLFPGHMYFPTKVLWDGVRNYIACLCLHRSSKADALDFLYIWDVKTGARERVLRGAAAHSMFDHFLKSINESSLSGTLVNGNTSASSLIFPIVEQSKLPLSNSAFSRKSISPGISTESKIDTKATGSLHAMKGFFAKSVSFQSGMHPITSCSPFPGVSTLCFDLDCLMSLCSSTGLSEDESHIGEKHFMKEAGTSRPKGDASQRANALLGEPGGELPGPQNVNGKSVSVSDGPSVVTLEHNDWAHSLDGRLLQFSLSFLHLWNIDNELDNLLVTEMKLKRPDSFVVSSGMLGDRGSMTITFPGSSSTLELWRSSSEYSALRSLTMVALSQHLTSLSHSCSSASRS
ncbi:Transducin/WD40 repeat-like superfamily protein [Striga hermonthica]|uniref:Transducin/WD40 repeat-like superfamily protein n=1 Tax=Striga hermonthica TaxID=68872 RepID=A0A9N7MJM4_STRHE|nr:Transducin/WD40 repeat-like superfamily protein [Striga hermonthica]